MATAAKKTVPATTRRQLTVPESSKTQIADSGDIVEETTGDKITLGAQPTTEGEKVTVVVPHAYKLTQDNGVEVRYDAGTQEMLVEHAAHWFSRAQGVKVYSPE